MNKETIRKRLPWRLNTHHVDCTHTIQPPDCPAVGVSLSSIIGEGGIVGGGAGSKTGERGIAFPAVSVGGGSGGSIGGTLEGGGGGRFTGGGASPSGGTGPRGEGTCPRGKGGMAPKGGGGGGMGKARLVEDAGLDVVADGSFGFELDKE